MFNFSIYVFMQVLLGFGIIAELLASSWNVECKSLNYTSKLISTGNTGFINLTPDFSLKPGFNSWNLDLNNQRAK